ncbi:MAG: PAS domain S-box protein, partial [Leptolyngbyaceae bacterium]|nr:PAS domain S-box protein [Leptolyngbyaceae bacterium]
MQQPIYLLQTMFQAISEAPDFPTALGIALRMVCETTGWNYGEAWVPRADGTALECSPAWYSNANQFGNLPPAIEQFRASSQDMIVPFGEGLPGRVWVSQQPEWIHDVSSLLSTAFLRATLAQLAGLKAALGVPITTPIKPQQPEHDLTGERQVIAVLVFFMLEPKSEDKPIVELVSTVATQLGSVIRQKQTEEALRRAEERYRSIFENALDGIFQTTPDGKYISANPALAHIYGYSSPQELMAGLADIEHQLYVHPSRRSDFVALMQRHDAVSGFESQIYRKDLSVIWISENARAVRDHNGKLLYYEGTVENITERKHAEEALRKSEAKNRALLNVIPDLMFRISKEGCYLDFKPVKQDDESLTPDEVVGRNLFEILPPEVAKQAQFHVDQALKTSEIQRFEYQLLEQGSPRDYEARLVVSGEDEVLAIVRDITERKKIESMKNEFVSMVSHELRTPLTSVRGSLGLIIGGVAGEIPAQAKALIEIAHKNSERLVLLINDILDIEKIESGKMDFHLQPLDLIALVEQAITANQAYADQHGVKFVLQPTVLKAKVNADSDRLTQVLTNLLSNAAKFSP